jgi:6-phosphogluconolactonase
MTGPAIEVLADDAALGRRGAEHVVASLERAIARHGRAHVALTGGGTAVILYRAIASAPFRNRVDWGRVHLWWGDDRFVPFDHHDSNVLLVEETLLRLPLLVAPPGGAAAGRPEPGAVPPVGPAEEAEEAGIVIPAGNLHPFPIPDAEAAGEGPGWCAARYAAQIAGLVPAGRGGLPTFDLVLLGIGPDGHFLSVFPGSPLVDAPAPPLCAGVPAPTTIGPHVPRVTISPRLTEVAADVLVMAAGAAKAGVIREVLAGPRDPHLHPSALAAREGATWLLDAAAAAHLPEEMRRPQG